MSIVSAKLGIELGMHETKNMYMITKKIMNKGQVYISVRSSCDIMLKFFDISQVGKISSFKFLDNWAMRTN